MMRVEANGKAKPIMFRLFIALVLALFLLTGLGGAVIRAQTSPPVEVKPLPTPERVSIPPEVLRQIDADLVSAQEVQGEGLPNPINWIIQKIVTVTVEIPWQHVTNALSKIFSAAVGRDMGMFNSAKNKLHDLAVSVAWGLLRKEELGAIGGRVAAATLGIAVPFYLLRLLIYHWRRLMGEPDDLLSVVGDWLTAGALAAMVPNIVVLALDTGLLISEKAFGGRLPDLMGQWVDVMLNPYGNLVSLLGLASEIGFMSVIGLFLMAILTVAAVAAIIFIVAAVMAVSYLLVAIGPIACVMSVVPQMRWARSMWLKAVFLVGVTPIAIGVVYFAFFQVFMPVGGASYAGSPSLESINPFAFLTRLVWLVGATGFLLSVAGSIGRVGLGSAVMAINMSRRAVAAVVGLATAAVTGGAALAVGAGALASTGGVKGLMGATGMGGTISSGLSGLRGFFGGGGGNAGTAGGAGVTSAPTTNVGTPSPGQTLSGSTPTVADRVDDLMQRAVRARGAAMALGMLGRRTLSGFFHLGAMNLERQAWGEQIRQRMEEDPGVHAPRIAEEMSQSLKQPVNDVTAKGVLAGVRQEGGNVTHAMEGFRQLLQDWRATGGTDKQLSDLMRARPRDVGRIVAAYQRGLPGNSPKERLAYARDVLTLGGYTARALADRAAWKGGDLGEGPAPSPASGPESGPPAGQSGRQEERRTRRTEQVTRDEVEEVTRRVQTNRRVEVREEKASGMASTGPETVGGQGGESLSSSNLQLHKTLREVQGDQAHGRGAGTVGIPNAGERFSANQSFQPPSTVGGDDEGDTPTTVGTPGIGGASFPTAPTPSTIRGEKEAGGHVSLSITVNDDMAFAYRRLPASGQRLVADFAHYAPGVGGSPAKTQMVIGHTVHMKDAFPERTEVLFEEYARARQEFRGDDAESVALAWEQAKEAYGRRLYGEDWREEVKRDPLISSLDGYMS